MPLERPPSPSRTLTLPYHELAWDEFEELCRALLASQPEIDPEDTELFETQGLDQFGIDALARGRDGSWVAQSCKREAKAPPAKIAEWSTDFLDHWEARWSKYPIREFILCISARVRTEAARQEIARQQERFAKFGVRYVVWHAVGLDDLLRSEPSIVGRHFPGWAERHCGVEPLPPITVRSDTRLIAFERNVPEDLERLVSAWNAGATLEARKLIDRLGRAAEYGQLDDAGQRTFRRIAVAEAFDASGLDGASAVRRTHPGEIGCDLEALLAMGRDGPEAALRELDAGEGPFPVARAQILLGAGRFEEAAEVLAFPTDATETALRAKALAALGRRDEAMATQRLAEVSAPDDAAIARIGMAVRYACCVGAAGICEQAWPEPLPDEMYRSDVDALALLREGARIAHARAGMPGQTEIERGQWQTWRLAFLSCDRAARAEAAEYARALVEDGSAHPGIVAWAIWCDLEIDRKVAGRDLERMVRNGSGGLEHLTALLFLLEAGGDTDKARTVLAASVARFNRDRGFEAIRSTWLRRLESSGPPDAFAAALRAAVRDGHWADLAQAVEQAPRGTFEGARRTVLAASAMERFGRFAELLALAPRLTDDVATADAVEMAAHAHLAKGNWEAVVGLLGDSDEGPDPALRPRAAAMLAEARSRSGDPAAALRLRMRLKGTVADPSGIGLARSYLELADLNSAAAAAAQIELESLRPDEAVSAISIARLANPAAARELAERALAMPRLRDDLLPGLLPLGHSLELADRLGPLLAAAIADKRVQGSSMSVDELAGFMEERRLHAEEVNRLHRRGELPIAIFAAAVNLDTAELMLGGSSVGPSPQILAQHASRPVPGRPGPDGTVPVPARPARLVLDLPAFLLAHRIGMLPDLKRVFGRLAIPRGLPLALAEATSRADNARAAMRTAHERIAEALRCGSAVITDEAPGLLVGEPREGADMTFESFLDLLDADGDAVSALTDVEPESVGFADVPIEALSMSRGWQAACDRYVLHLSPRQRAESERAGEAVRLDAMRAGTLRAAATELSDGLRRGAYEMLPSRPSHELHDVVRSSADEAVLADLFLSQLPDDAAVLSGDRCLNGFASLETVPVVGMGVVVEWLADAGITQARVRRFRHELREANVRFTSCPRADILRELSRSRVRDGMVEETVELAAMRRQVARDLALEADWRLDGSSGLDGQGFEWEAARHFGIDATQVLRDVWTDRTSDLATKTARADYLMAMFVTDRLDRIPLADDGAAKAKWCGMAVGRLYEVAFEAGLNGIDRAIEVVNWIDARCLGRWTRGRPEFRETAGDTLAALLDVLTNEKALSGILDRDQLPFYQRRVADIFALLPEWLQDRVLERTIVPGIESGEHLLFGGHRVALRAFETALATASRDGAAFVTVSSDEGEREGVLGRRDIAEGRVDIVLPDRRIRLANLRLALVMADAADVDMTTSAAVAGMSASERRRFADRMGAGVGTMEAAARIVDDFQSLRLACAEAQFLSDSVPAASLHPPAPEVLAMQLGWLVTNIFDPTALPWDGSEAYGAGQTPVPADVAALLHVPRPLPAWVSPAIRQFPDGARRVFVDELARLAPSALPRAHLRRLASEVDPRRGALPVPTLDECDALAALFRWTWRLTETMEEWRAITMPARLVLCWSHASQLADLFARGGMAPGGLRAVVDEWDRPGIEAVLLPSHDVDGEIAGPDITAKAILLSLHALAVPDPDVEEVDALLDLARSGPAGGDGSEPPLPDPFLAETTRLPDAIGSVFGSFRKEPPAWLVSFGQWFDPEHLEASVEAGIPWNSDDAFDSGTWCTYLHLRRRGIPEDEMDGLVDTISSDGFVHAIASDPQWTAALSLLVASKHRMPEKGRALLAAALNTVAVDRAQSADADPWTEHVFRFLRSPPGDGQLDRLVANVRRMAPAMLAQPSTWCSVLTVLARQLGPDASAEIWKIVLALRGA